MGEDVLSEVTRDVDSTSGLELWETINVHELGAVRNEETSTDGGQHWHRDVGQLGITDVSDITTNIGQVWCHDRLHVGSVNTERGVDGLKGWNGELGDVADGHVVGPDQVWKLEVQVKAVVVDGQSLGDVGDLGGDGAEESVVGDLEGVDLLEVDALEGGEGGISDEDSLGLGQWSLEVQRLEGVERGPVESTDLRENWHGQVGHDGQGLEVHGSANGGEAVGGELGQLDNLNRSQITRNLRDTIKVDGALNSVGNLDVSVEFLALGGDVGGIGLVLDGGILGTDLWSLLGCRREKLASCPSQL